METERKRYKYYSWGVKMFLFVSGLWPNQRPSILNGFLLFLSFSTNLFVMLVVSNFCFHNLSNITVLTQGMGLAAAFTLSFMKVCAFILHKDDLVYLNNFLSANYDRDMLSKKNHLRLLKKISTFFFLFIVYACMVLRVMSFYIIRPVKMYRKYGKYVRAFPIGYPISYDSKEFVHWMLYFVEFSGAISMWTVSIGVDGFLGLYTFQACGEFRVLAEKFQSLKFDVDYKKNLKDCVTRHHILINVKYRLEKIYGLITVWLTVSGAFSLCSLIFQVTQVAEKQVTLATTIHYLLHFIPKLMQIFTYAWYGELISVESAKCLNYIYYSHWPDTNNMCFKNDIMIILLQRPLVLVAKGIVRIQLDMFTKIFKMSVSYFYLLRTINEPDS